MMSRFFEEYFNRQQDLREAENQEFWNPIFNAGEAADEADRLSWSTRYMTTRRGIADEMERTTENHWVVKRRALLDARMGQICVCLGLEDNQVAVHKMFAPKTGGRVLCTGRGCPRQKLHTDFQTLTIPEKLNEKNLGYFMIAPGKYLFPLWVCEGSHKHFATTNAELEAVSGGYATRKFLIPPLSIFIGRGDVSHAGAGSRDAIMAQNFLFRYHIYMVPEDYKLPDAVQLQSSLRPRFVEDEDLIRKDKSGTKGTILLPGVGDNEERSADDRVSQEPLEDDEDPQNESDGEYDRNEDGNDNSDDAIYTQEEGEKGDEDIEEDN